MQMELLTALERMGVTVDVGAKVYVIVVPPGGAERAERRRAAWVVGANEARSALDFFDQLGTMARGDPPTLPCTSADLYDWYRLWCTRSGIEPLIQPRFARALAQGGRVRASCKRYRDSAGGVHQKAISFSASSNDWPTGKCGQQSLGRDVEAFREALGRYRASLD